MTGEVNWADIVEEYRRAPAGWGAPWLPSPIGESREPKRRMQAMNHAGEWIDITPMVEHPSLTEVLGVLVSERAWEIEHLYGGMTGEPRGILGQLDREPVPAAPGMSLLPDWATQRRPA